VAAEPLILIGECDGDPMLANIGMLRALHRDRPVTVKTPRRKAPKALKHDLITAATTAMTAPSRWRVNPGAGAR